MITGLKENDVKIDPKNIPDSEYEIGCSVLASSVKNLFMQQGIQEEYEEWMKNEKL